MLLTRYLICNPTFGDDIVEKIDWELLLSTPINQTCYDEMCQLWMQFSFIGGRFVDVILDNNILNFFSETFAGQRSKISLILSTVIKNIVFHSTTDQLMRIIDHPFTCQVLQFAAEFGDEYGFMIITILVRILSTCPPEFKARITERWTQMGAVTEIENICESEDEDLAMAAQELYTVLFG